MKNYIVNELIAAMKERIPRGINLANYLTDALCMGCLLYTSFPNKRASLFFNEHLANQSDQPLWSPAYLSISELFQHLSVLKLGDPIRLVCELYKIFREETNSDESLDDFYFWGELLISDFDDVDKNLVHACLLYTSKL